MKNFIITLFCILLINCGNLKKPQMIHATKLGPSEVVAQSLDSEWRSINNNNSLYIELETGLVIVEMLEKYAPINIENTKTLVREKLFDDTSFYRVLDGFVAQGGPDENSEKLSQFSKEQLTNSPEFVFVSEKPFEITELNELDGYADRVGYYGGFTVGQSKDKKQNWLLHCYGAMGMGRGNELDSGATELYVVIGQSPRYLDKNITVFGRVVYGMPHLQSLKRSSSLSGPVDLTGQNSILSIKVASDMNEKDLIPLELMKTDSASFKKLIQSRKNRSNPWFVDSKDFIDVCGVTVPVRLKNK